MSWKTANWKNAMFIGLLAATVAVGCAKKQEEAAPAPEPAAAPAPMEMQMDTVATTLQAREGSTVAGTVTFSQEGDGPVKIVAEVSGVTGSGEHGFHIHEKGDCSAPDFTSAGGHFNPGETIHGGPMDPEHHAGDLGNIEIGEDGTGRLEISSDMLTLGEGPNSIIGRSVILHEKSDDLVSQPTGAAGGRIACGVIGGGDAKDEMAEDKMGEDKMGEGEAH